MKPKVLIADDSPRDLQRLCSLAEEIGFEAHSCSSGVEAAKYISLAPSTLAAFILSWEIPGPPFGSELLIRSRRAIPHLSLIVVSSALDASLATSAFALGANDFLEKPLDMRRVKSCLLSVMKDSNPDSPLLQELNETILGKSPALLSTLRQAVKAIEHKAPRILLVGESGTGKELFAESIHNLSATPHAPFVAVNIAAIPRDLIESELFGHEKGAFTGATDTHRGYMEQAGIGTLFLDEIGDLEFPLQVKLLRALQENKFRRLKGKADIHLQARVVCATNRDLNNAVKEGLFRQDLFHRINEVTIEISPLRERVGDIELLAGYFLSVHSGDRSVRFARETLSILRSYPFFSGNIRELENFIKRSLMQCENDLILPQHLPLSMMSVFLKPSGEELTSSYDDANRDLFLEITNSLPQNWRDLPYKEAMDQYQRAFDRVYLPNLIKNHHYNVSKATKAADVDKKTFAQHWKNAGLLPIRGGETDQ